MSFKKLISIFVLVICIIACGKVVKIGEMSQPSGNGDSNKQDPTVSCATEDVSRWSFVQPSDSSHGTVDLLFVVDTSSSLGEKRAKIADSISSFVQELKNGINYRIAVMLAHGGASKLSGALYAPLGVPLVLDSIISSVSSIQKSLKRSLSNVIGDVDEADGEMMIYSLLSSLNGKKLEVIRNQGFYRKRAALSVVFVSDENDICFSPQENGYTQFPDFSPSWNNTEEIAYKRYCQGSPAIWDKAFSQLQALKGDQLLSLAGIVYLDRSKITLKTEEAIGHGILEFVPRAANHAIIDLGDNDYNEGLKKVGEIVSNQVNLLTSFKLEGQKSIVSGTLKVEVDGALIESFYNAEKRLLQIKAVDAGKGGSLIEVSACTAS